MFSLLLYVELTLMKMYKCCSIINYLMLAIALTNVNE